MPELEALRREYEPKGVGFLAVSLEPDRKLVREAVKAMGVEMRVATVEDEVLAPLSVNQVPSTVFLSKDGIIVAAASGERKRPFLEKRVRELLGP